MNYANSVTANATLKINRNYGQRREQLYLLLLVVILVGVVYLSQTV